VGPSANGLLPAFVDLSVDSGRFPWQSEGEKRPLQLARALEGVAGTLRRLTLEDLALSDAPPSTACHQLGVAIGKMRHLCHLSLRLSQDGRAYQDVGRGLAASGGCPPLFELHLNEVRQNIGCLTAEPSLILPSVRSLHISGGLRNKGDDATVLLCALVQMGYKYGLTTELDVDQNYKSCLAAIVKTIATTHGRG
jgi:hypothetical protein